MTVENIATDLLTWVGVHPLADGLPLPAAPVSALVESLWLAVRHGRHTLDGQRPPADETSSGPIPRAWCRAAETESVAPQAGPELSALAARAGVEVTTTGNGAARTIDGRFTDQVVTDADDAAAVMNALASALGAAAGFADPASVTATRVGAGAATENVYRFTESVGGLQVLGSEVILLTDADGVVTGLVNNYRGLSGSFDVTPDGAVDDDAEIRLIAGGAYLGSGATRAALHRLLRRSSFTEELVVYALDDQSPPSLAWRVVVQPPGVRGRSTPGTTYVIEAAGADAGDIIATVANAAPYTATGIGTDWSGRSRVLTVDVRKIRWFSVYRLVDADRDITTYKTSFTMWGFGGPVLPGRVVKRGLFGWNADAVSAHANTADVYDYYRDVLGRTSFDGNGAEVDVSIAYSPVTATAGYANAFWDPTRRQFAFGNSGHLQAAVDVIGHEFTHAVLSYVVGGPAGGSVLDYGESGALNEALADIMGVLIEGKSGTGRWLLGEDSQLGAVRNLADPTSILTAIGPYRDHYSTRYKGLSDDGGEHVNSTIFSHAAYVMMTDPATAGISDDTWASVFYHALYRLSPGAVFTDGRAAVLSAARALGLTGAQLTAIGNAFDDVGIPATATSSTVAA